MLFPIYFCLPLTLIIISFFRPVERYMSTAISYLSDAPAYERGGSDLQQDVDVTTTIEPSRSIMKPFTYEETLATWSRKNLWSDSSSENPTSTCEAANAESVIPGLLDRVLDASANGLYDVCLSVQGKAEPLSLHARLTR